jgi:FkbM family methyltransferase
MFQAVFNGALSARGETGRFIRRLRRWILKCSDPLVTWELNGRKLRLRLSHQLPFYRREFPTYSANLERLAKVLRRVYGPLIMIDVGANIGDSLALAGIEPGDACLLIEGDPEYLRLLRQNTADLANATCVAAMLSDQAGPADVRLVSIGGTGKVVAAGQQPKQADLQTLDRLIEQQPRFKESQLLKIDVDGYDFRVLRGGACFIRSTQPVLFFEQHPRLLEAAGERADDIWAWLAAAGYTQVFLYDHFGYWLGSFALVEQAALCDLNSYARQRTDAYYDVTAFAPRHTQIQTVFTAQEKAFYHSLGSARSTP